MSRAVIIWALVLLLVSCEDPYPYSSMPVAPDLIVVEAVITNENKNHLVRLTRPISAPKERPLPVTGALVQIYEDATTYVTLSESPANSGLYYTPVARAVFGKTYTLRIVHNGKEYLAQDASRPVDALPAIGIAPSDSLDYFQLQDPADGNSANYIEHHISWVGTKYCAAASSCEGRIITYDLKNLDVNDQFKPAKTSFLFPLGSQVIRRKHSVSEAYRSYLRSILSETEWRGGVFDVERSNASTNLSKGAVGFFAVTTVVSDTTIVN